MKSPVRFITITGVCIAILLSCSLLPRGDSEPAVFHTFSWPNTALNVKPSADMPQNDAVGPNQDASSAAAANPLVAANDSPLPAQFARYAVPGSGDGDATHGQGPAELTPDSFGPPDAPIGIDKYLFPDRHWQASPNTQGSSPNPQGQGGTPPFHDPGEVYWPTIVNPGAPGGSGGPGAIDPPAENTPKPDNAAAPVPEPSTMLLLGIGLFVLAGIGRKKQVDSYRNSTARVAAPPSHPPASSQWNQ